MEKSAQEMRAYAKKYNELKKKIRTKYLNDCDRIIYNNLKEKILNKSNCNAKNRYIPMFSNREELEKTKNKVSNFYNESFLWMM